MDGLRVVTRGDGRVGAHGRPAEEHEEEEGGGREEPDGGARRSGTRGEAAQGPRGHQTWFGDYCFDPCGHHHHYCHTAEPEILETPSPSGLFGLRQGKRKNKSLQGVSGNYGPL